MKGTVNTMLDGMLLVNKPRGMTSHDVVQVVRRKLSVRRVGHTGTLDPMAEGLLILLVGSATKHQQAFQRHEKLYEATLKLGTQTDTGDGDGQPIATAPVPALQREQLVEVLASFKGPLSQVPPTYSAVKVRGRPAYWWARRRTPVTLSSRTVHLADLTLIDRGVDTITFRVHCSAGTYIRTLAESIANRLGTVGHVSALVRLRVGRWNLDEAKGLDWIAQASPEVISQQLRALAASDTHALTPSPGP